MERPVNRKTLLVGEGDFSFTVAMVTKFPATKECEVISTSIESAESILKHKNASENIKLLQENGILVYLEVDATELHQHPILKDEKFSRIIFNFPHAGGKSNHKRNRKLLNDFFASAVHVLEEDGQILVTLCKGQGGTPADRPMRAWHDSWQVVSMAANSSLILVETKPFQIEDYETYTSTGFRSLDKGFHTDNAITHVFEKAKPVRVPDVAKDCYVTASGETYTCPRYIYNKLNVLREIDALKDHPFKTIPRQLTNMFAKEGKIAASMCSKTACLSTDAKIYSISDLLTCDSGNNQESLVQNDHCNESTNGNSNISNHQYRLKKTSSIEVDNPDKSLAKTLGTLQLLDPLCKYDSNYDNLSLRASILDNFKGTGNPSVGCFHIESGPVFRPCLIQTGNLPIQYQMLIVWQASTIANKTKNISIEHQINGPENKEVTGDDKEPMVGNERLENHNAKDEDCEIDGNVHTNIKENKAVFAVHIKKTIHNLEKVLGDHCNIEFHNQCKHKDRSEVLYAKKGVKSLGYFVIQCDDRELNSIPLGELVQLDENRKPEYSGHTALILFLDDIASVLFNIKEKRLLYSLDNRFTDQLLNSDSEDGCLGCEIKVPSLYPMTFVHDMSFWENERLEFDEIAFCDIIRNIADDIVFSVELIDKYKDPETGRFSRCYRMTFQSLDKALCYATSWKLQCLIRLEVEKHLEITLR